MKKVLPRLILAVIIQNCLFTIAYASDYQIKQSQKEEKQSKYKTLNAPNGTPTHTNNTVEWFYNSLNQGLSTFSEKETIETIKLSMQSWSNISGIKFVYKGKTNNLINNTKDGIITIGYWSNRAYITKFDSDGKAEAGLVKVLWAGLVPKITEGYMILNAGNNSKSGSIPKTLKDLKGLITHEVGHLLAIDHSENEDSIMHTKPYHPYEYQAILKDDDIRIASLLYPHSTNKPLTAVRPNFQIVIGSATYVSPNGKSNIRAVLDFKGTDSSGDYFWKLKAYSINKSNTNKPLTTVKSNLDIVIESAQYHSSNGVSNIWAILEFKGTDSAGDIIWQLKTYGNN